MTLSLAIATIIGAFIFPFVVKVSWEPMVKEWGSLGGWMAAAFIVGTIWALNHGLSTPMITQTGAWIDQGLAVGIGVWVSTTILGGSAKESVKNIISAIVGGILAGAILFLFLA